MIDIYAFTTPNSLKVPIVLEELGLPYNLHAVNLRQGEQKVDTFKALNPNAKVPVMVDRLDGADVTLGESAAILVHFAEKTGRLLPRQGAGRDKVFEQLFFHASGASPAFLGAFLVAIQAAPEPDAKARALAEVARVLGVLDQVLATNEYVAGSDYSIADIAHFGWLWRHQAIGADLAPYAHLTRWYAQVAARPAVVSAIAKTVALSQ